MQNENLRNSLAALKPGEVVAVATVKTTIYKAVQKMLHEEGFVIDQSLSDGMADAYVRQGRRIMLLRPTR